MRAWAAAGLLGLLAAACSGGSSDDAPAATTVSTTSQAQTNSASATSAASTTSAASAPEATATTAPEPTAAPALAGIELFESFTPVPVPDLTGARLVTQPDDIGLGEALMQVLTEAGGALPGLKLYVFSIAQTDQKMLVVDVTDTGASQDSVTAGQSVMQTLLLAPQIAEGNITRLTMNIRTTDAQGPMVIVLTLPIDQVKVAAGADITADVIAEVKRP